MIETIGLSKNYGSVIALNNVTLNITEGTVGLLGPNGAGKSTFLKIVSGLLPPTTGIVKIFGKNLYNAKDGLKLKERIGLMPEYPCLMEHLNAVEFIMYMGLLTGMGRKDAIMRAHEVLDYCRIGEERYRLIKDYSAGMKQKVKLAQALVHDPDIILLDEPVAGVDLQSRNEILGLIRELKELKNKLIIISTHILEDVEALCEDVILIDRGQIALQGKIKELLRHDVGYIAVKIKGNIDTFVKDIRARGYNVKVLRNEIRIYTRTSEEAISDVIDVCAIHGLQLRSMNKGIRTLEDVFLIAVRGYELAI